MAKFEKVSRFADVDFNLPTRKTQNSAGYDFEVAEDIVIPTYDSLVRQYTNHLNQLPAYPTLTDIGRLTKSLNVRPTLVSTGVKCKLDPGTYLELSMRSSSPLKYWLVCANSVGRLFA